jgi:hypothetical protein
VPVLELNVLLGRLQQMGSDLGGLLDDLVQAHLDGDTSHGHGAGAEGPDAELHAARVPLHNLDVVERHA